MIYWDENLNQNYSLFRARGCLLFAKITTSILRHHLATFSCPQGIKRSVFHWSENHDICASVCDAMRLLVVTWGNGKCLWRKCVLAQVDLMSTLKAPCMKKVVILKKIALKCKNTSTFFYILYSSWVYTWTMAYLAALRNLSNIHKVMTVCQLALFGNEGLKASFSVCLFFKACKNEPLVSFWSFMPFSHRWSIPSSLFRIFCILQFWHCWLMCSLFLQLQDWKH